MQLEAVIEQFGDALGGYDRGSLEIHLEGVIEGAPGLNSSVS